MYIEHRFAEDSEIEVDGKWEVPSNMDFRVNFLDLDVLRRWTLNFEFERGAVEGLTFFGGTNESDIFFARQKDRMRTFDCYRAGVFGLFSPEIICRCWRVEIIAGRFGTRFD